MTMQPGDELAGVERTVTQAQVEAYADAAGDHNPIHLDAEFAAKTPFGRRIAHGMLTLAMVSEMLTSAYPDNWASGGRLKVRFRAPVFPGETVHVSGEVKKVTDTGGVQTTEITVNVKKDDGEDVITGQAFVQIN
ncbi:MAG: MaoC family dehydratase [Chloroflexi bacterium]|jgi:3-hydroxybutyryl-CoA dehydratase|nr:MaoC family dehydratase [Chloroflexota bacterium]MBT4074061.1 MaoC family dehydratase [Chloroflexota bacterium]MBT4514800.1 MaoC family dehydratase [Chloroflexota bacterium]MBT5319381.1 MaoC family dehydratase [Chloroflexota bacterium]